MTNTYVINTTRGKEFEVESDLTDMGLHPWVPRQLDSTYVKERREYVWYDKPYVGKLIFCVIPAIYYRDVMEHKQVHGKPFELSRLGIEGIPAHRKTWGEVVPEVPGLKQFKQVVEAEYADRQRKKANSEYQCKYQPGQALDILSGVFEGMDSQFDGVTQREFDAYPMIRVDVDFMGQKVAVVLDPDAVRERA